ncbi:prolyl oligopeptidase family protein [Pseudomonas saudimassiliensis]|uniref:Prolyl oligopeptidase family protein n=1 Tax=Pseudomonas saudimassiliensis TaxID=1461581 RepID=A0A078MFU4_9PSED|nr:S9 family peptidase [Pseudomonas saudimassiliensis]CEA05174.1 prolyl oligopeptidase family protein [Pseudomonas saudimassiliensis]CEF27004.1 prolyl oligopeptidase family protein [Pseudomonas saudimassiliensis]
MSVPPESSAGVEPAGYWHSEFSAADAVAAGTDYADLTCDDQRVVWVEFLPAAGLSAAMQWAGGAVHRLTPPGYSVRSRVYEYGGGALCLAGDSLVFVNEADQQLYRQTLDDLACSQLSFAADCRYGGLVFDLLRQRVIAVEEQHGGAQPTHRLVAIDLAGNRQLLAEGADFYNSPCLSPDGQRLAWIEWQRPELPWTVSSLCWTELDDQGLPGEVERMGSDESVQQPLFDSQGALLCLTDRSGYWQPWRLTMDQQWQLLPSRDADHAPAPWQLNPRHFLTLPNGGLVLNWSDGGYGRLVLRHVDTVDEQPLAEDFTRFRALAHNSSGLFCLASSPDCSAAVLHIALPGGEVSVLAQAPHSLPPEDISRPVRLAYPSAQEEIAYGFYYPPRNGQASLAPDERPPLVIFTHGGPTSACYPVLDNRIQFWTQRGFAVADLNYRGSVGFGRAYRQRLQGHWGETDVEDVLAAIDYLTQRDLIDPDRVFIRGQSAGGFTTLSSLVHASGRFRAAASLYGVSDPLQLRAVTHKFEADYIDWLIGDPLTQPERYRQRSPLEQAAGITTPVIFFQGLQDAVVLPAQTEQMVAALEEQGVPVEYVAFNEERHGFRRPGNLQQVLEQELDFYRRYL